MKNDAVYIRHILEEAARIERFIKDVSFDDFSGNEMMLAAVVRELEIIGD